MVSALTKVIYPESRVYRFLVVWRWLPAAVLASVAVVVFLMALDRTPPFEVLRYTTVPAKPGGVALIYAEVRRDLHRNCSVELSSHLFDSSGARWEYGGAQMTTPQGIRDIDAAAPGRLERKVALPHEIAPGPASVKSSMIYRCNMLQDVLRPIYVQTEFKFEVLPP